MIGRRNTYCVSFSTITSPWLDGARDKSHARGADATAIFAARDESRRARRHVATRGRDGVRWIRWVRRGAAAAVAVRRGAAAAAAGRRVRRDGDSTGDDGRVRRWIRGAGRGERGVRERDRRRAGRGAGGGGRVQVLEPREL